MNDGGGRDDGEVIAGELSLMAAGNKLAAAVDDEFRGKLLPGRSQLRAVGSTIESTRRDADGGAKVTTAKAETKADAIIFALLRKLVVRVFVLCDHV